jgi:hypothetical protein
VEQQRVVRLEYQLTRKTLDVSLNDYSFWDAMATAFKYCQEIPQLFQKQVLDVLFDTQKEGYISWSKDKKDVLVSRISKAINDNCLVLNEKEKLVQADDCINQIAMVSWLASPSQYKQDKAMSIEIFPSQLIMYQNFKKIRCEEGVPTNVWHVS